MTGNIIISAVEQNVIVSTCALSLSLSLSVVNFYLQMKDNEGFKKKTEINMYS
jgi:hypothetical protein